MPENTKTILITGGSRGIGAATAKLAAQAGYQVVFSYHSDEASAQEVAARIKKSGMAALAVQADMAKESDIVRLWERSIEFAGPVNAFVNNAGILEKQMPLADFSVERLELLFSVNVIGSILACREAVRHMSTTRGGVGGSIVNISSVASRLGGANEYIDYAASKGAIDTLTVGLAKEVASEGIRVNAVRPGGTYTDIHASGGEPNRLDRIAPNIPMKRGGYPNEIAEAILWLISDRASYSTGSILDVTGGV